MNIEKTYKFLVCLGIFILIVLFLIPGYYIWKFILAIFSLILIILGVVLNKKIKIFIRFFLVVFIILGIYFIDYGSFLFFKRIPLYAIKVKSSENLSTYNSFIYRVYDCDGKLIHDEFYEERYVCGEEHLTTIDINDFLERPKENFKKYKNKFIKISGKVSSITGSNILDMQKYINDVNNPLNGYVLFNDAYIIRTTFDIGVDLTTSRIYDEVSVIGRVSKLERNGSQYILELVDSIFLPSKMYDEFLVDVKANKSNSKELIMDNIYMTGLEHFYIKYNEMNIYDLKYAFLDRRITLDDFLDIDFESVNKNTLYEFDNYNILVCANNDILFGSKKLKVNNINCPEIEEGSVLDEKE